MHANDHGLGGKHFWPQAKRLVEELGNNAAQLIDDQYVMQFTICRWFYFIFCRMKALPPWPGLNHFDQVMGIHFSDANKFRDILKVTVCIFVIY
jgi:hypothetical protein